MECRELPFRGPPIHATGYPGGAEWVNGDQKALMRPFAPRPSTIRLLIEASRFRNAAERQNVNRFGTAEEARMEREPSNFDDITKAPTALCEEPGGSSTFPQSRADFLDALWLLAAELANLGSTSMPPSDETCRVWRVFVSCPFTTWQQTFGDPQAVTHYEHDSIRYPVAVWQHQCSDGLVKCVGHILQEPRQQRRIVVARVCLV